MYTNRNQTLILSLIACFFLLWSFYPTIYELRNRHEIKDPAREFILEHNYYWPDYNLYLSKIRQADYGVWFPKEKYTTETHDGSMIQILYTILGHIGHTMGLSPNNTYLLGRILFAPLLLFLIIRYCMMLFDKFFWRVTSFLVVITSGSFPRWYQDSTGAWHIGRYMEWWSNIDALQRITFIPHILFGQICSFFLLYHMCFKKYPPTGWMLVSCLIIGNAAGIVFPPSLMTLLAVLLIMEVCALPKWNPKTWVIWKYETWNISFLFILSTLPSLLYLYATTQQIPWSALVQFHQTHPMPIPFWEYFLGTGPITILAILGSILVFYKKQWNYLPLVCWIVSTVAFSLLFSVIKEQSPLRFTQTGLYIPLGLLGTYVFSTFFPDIPTWIKKPSVKLKSLLGIFLVCVYISGSLFMMTTSMNWQTTWISQRLGANIPPVPYPPQAVYPLTAWMDGIRWLRDHTHPDDIVLADITAGNYIPAYSGNTVYFGQSNTVDYERKQNEVSRFFKGEMSDREAELFIKNGHITYIFYSIQEHAQNSNITLPSLYPSLRIKTKYTNSDTTIYEVKDLY